MPDHNPETNTVQNTDTNTNPTTAERLEALASQAWDLASELEEQGLLDAASAAEAAAEALQEAAGEAS